MKTGQPRRCWWLRFCLVVSLSIGASFAQAATAGRVRVLAVIDRESRLAGLEYDAYHMHAIFAAAVEGDPDRSIKMLTRDVSPTSILDAIAEWRDSGPNDVLVFYYGGHGGTHVDHGHILATSNGFLRRSDLRRAMIAHSPRLAVILTDCCSNSVPGPSAQAGGAVALDPIGDLFRHHRGLVDITGATYTPAAGDGESAWGGRKGGMFTNAIAKLINSNRVDLNRDGFVSWNEFATQLQRETRTQYSAYRRQLLAAEGLDQDTRQRLLRQQHQTPQVFSLAEATAGDAQDEHYAGNLGIFFRMVSTRRGPGAKLTRAPLFGSPALLDEFEQGDLIVGLDTEAGYRLRSPFDLQLHRKETKVDYVNMRTGGSGSTTLNLGSWHIPDFEASNLGACYVLRPYGQNYGVHITRKPRSTSPLGRIDIEPGDVIVELDGDPIRSHRDVLRYYGRTTVKVINVRTGRLVVDTAQLTPNRGQLKVPGDFIDGE